jgi:hypothetical protein
MSVKKDASGRRYTEVRVELPGTPEEPWPAIATGPGTAALGTIEFGDTVMATLSFYLYGPQADATVAVETPRWQAWLKERFGA